MARYENRTTGQSVNAGPQQQPKRVGGGSGSVGDPGEILYGTAGGPLLTAEGRGVRNGIPYGEQLQTEARGLIERYRHQPAARKRLRAATRQALGR